MNRWLRYIPLWCYPLLFFATVAISNDFYTHGSFPAASSPATSASMRAEFDLISAGFDKMPPLTGNNNKVVTVNAGATGLTVTSASLILGGNLTITGNFATTLATQAPVTLTLPALSGTLATTNATETFTNKTISVGSNTLTGTTAQFNAALSDNDFATLTGTETLVGKTLSNATINNANLTGGFIAGPTLLSGSFLGTYSFDGTPTITGATITSPTITSPSVTGNGAGALVLIDTKTASAQAVVDFFSGIDSTYDEYLLTLVDIIPATNGADLNMRVSQDSGATYKSGASDYKWASTIIAENAVTTGQGDTADSEIKIMNSLSNAAGRPFSCRVRFYKPAGTALSKQFLFDGALVTSGALFGAFSGGGVFVLNTGSITGIRFLMSSGNITSGSFYLYGVRKA